MHRFLAYQLNLAVGAVDCNRHRGVCSHVSGFPELYLFNGDEEDERTVEDGIAYQGESYS